MKKKQLIGIIFVLTLLAIPFFQSAQASDESDDFFTQYETIKEGTYSGKLNWSTENYEDLYQIIIPPNTKMNVRVERKDIGDYEIFCSGLFSTDILDDDPGLLLGVESQGQTDEGYHINYDDNNNETYYLLFSGEGKYEFEIQFEDCTDDPPSDPFQWFCCGSILTIILILFISLIIFLIKSIKKKK